MLAASTPEAGAGADAEDVEQEQSTFDIFVQSIDLRWCLLLHCDYASLTAMRQLCSAFLQHVPIALNSEEWGASANSAELHAAQWAAGGDDVLHKPLSQFVGQTIVRLQCPDDEARQVALAHGAQLDESGHPVMVLSHPIGIERMLNARQLSARAPPLRPFLRDPLVCTTTVIAGATHKLGVQSVSVAPDAIPLSEQDAAEAAARSVRAHRSRHLVASGGLDCISRVWSLTSLGLPGDTPSLRAAPLSVQGALRHTGALSAVEVRPSGMLLTACQTNSTLRVYELEAAHLAAARIAEAGMLPPAVAPTAGLHEWNYVEHARLQDRHAEQQCVVAAKWLDETTLVEAGFADDDESELSSPRRVLRTWCIGNSPHRASVVAAENGFFPGSDHLGGENLSAFSSLAAGDGLVVVTHNPPRNGPGYADVWRHCDRAAPPGLDPDVWCAVHAADPPLVPLVRLKEHTAPLYASALGGGLLATGGDDCTVRLWSMDTAARLSLPSFLSLAADAATPTESLQTLQLPGNVWALALHSQLLVVGGALASGAGGVGGHICVRLFGVADLAAGRGNAVALRTLQAPSIAHEWGVRSVATHGGTVVVAGGDDGVVHVWTLAEKGKAGRGQHGTDRDGVEV